MCHIQQRTYPFPVILQQPTLSRSTDSVCHNLARLLLSHHESNFAVFLDQLQSVASHGYQRLPYF